MTLDDGGGGDGDAEIVRTARKVEAGWGGGGGDGVMGPVGRLGWDGFVVGVVGVGGNAVEVEAAREEEREGERWGGWLNEREICGVVVMGCKPNQWSLVLFPHRIVIS